jgi:hypothetical protein
MARWEKGELEQRRNGLKFKGKGNIRAVASFLVLMGKQLHQGAQTAHQVSTHAQAFCPYGDKLSIKSA